MLLLRSSMLAILVFAGVYSLVAAAKSNNSHVYRRSTFKNELYDFSIYSQQRRSISRLKKISITNPASTWPFVTAPKGGGLAATS